MRPLRLWPVVLPPFVFAVILSPTTSGAVGVVGRQAA
jgi:hypothetical protein